VPRDTRSAQLFPDGNDYFGRVGPEDTFFGVQMTYVITAVAVNGERDSERGTTTIHCIE
jgi:hypothetical protein